MLEAIVVLVQLRFGDYLTDLTDVVTWRDQVYVAGQFCSTVGPNLRCVRGMLASADGVQWSVLYETAPYDPWFAAGFEFDPRRLYATSEALVLTGYRLNATELPFGPAVWLASADGVEWTALELDPNLFNDRSEPSSYPWPVWDLAEFGGLLITPGGTEPMPYRPEGESRRVGEPAREAAPSPQILVWGP